MTSADIARPGVGVILSQLLGIPRISCLVDGYIKVGCRILPLVGALPVDTAETPRISACLLGGGVAFREYRGDLVMTASSQ